MGVNILGGKAKRRPGYATVRNAHCPEAVFGANRKSPTDCSNEKPRKRIVKKIAKMAFVAQPRLCGSASPVGQKNSSLSTALFKPL